MENGEEIILIAEITFDIRIDHTVKENDKDQINVISDKDGDFGETNIISVFLLELNGKESVARKFG